MKKFLGLAIGLFWVIVFVSSAQAAIKIEIAEVQNGVAFIKGNGAQLGAQVTWNGNAVTTANKQNGGFSFNGAVPADCIGELSDGVSTINVQLLDCTTVSVAPAPVPRTGQTSCYDAVGTMIPCAGTGQDGEFQKGVVSPNPRFTDNGLGTFTDNLTGLIWLKNGNCPDGLVTWQQALDFVAGINAGTYDCGDTSNGGSHQTDWRLPNIRELQTIYNYNQIPGHADFPFTGNLGSGNLWSSTTSIDAPANVWYALYDQAFEGFVPKTASGRVIAVRGGS